LPTFDFAPAAEGFGLSKADRRRRRRFVVAQLRWRATAEEMKMKTKELGRSIMAAGAACIMFYTLLAIWSVSTFNAVAGNILFYMGVVTVPLGIILLLTGEMNVAGSGRANRRFGRAEAVRPGRIKSTGSYRR
jgi:hypothetical protein